ncbi:nitroreductase [Dysgonomonas sp. 520]|uniref:nitroreductase family protein n=1 Tax=Dysgonomonas sp. 520 TaxID=2302931 RepID=UPI0013D70EE2|nr:nitroreductase [Dysgonomonas sp. 520]NDW10035.1 nitroreductase [Dysgonomonas sp. 520]
MKRIILLATVGLMLFSCEKANKGVDPAKEASQGNAVVESIMNRRSIRSYKPEQIKQEQLDTIMQCAINAPSARNLQAWEVRVIQNPDLLKRINDRFVEKTKAKEGSNVFHNSPTLIIVGKDKENPYSPVDCGLLAQNILLSAESMGIGTCVVGYVAVVFNDEVGKEFLKEIKMPDNFDVAFGISIGYKNESPEAKPRDANKVQYIK